jgi:hypothetical protein
MQPSHTHIRIRNFLYQRTSLRRDVARNFVIKRLRRITEITQQQKLPDDWTPSDEEISDYLKAHFSEVSERVDQIIDDTIKELLKRHRFTDLIKHSSWLFAAIIAAFSGLVRFLYSILQADVVNWTDVSIVSAGMLGLVIVFVWALIGVLKG